MTLSFFPSETLTWHTHSSAEADLHPSNIDGAAVRLYGCLTDLFTMTTSIPSVAIWWLNGREEHCVVEMDERLVAAHGTR